MSTTDGPAQSQVVTITADDGQGEIATASFVLIVNNVAPIVTITGAPISSSAGALISLGSIVTDPGANETSAGVTYAWRGTHNGAPVISGSGATLNFTPVVGGTYQVTLQVTDKDGGIGGDTVTLQVVQTNRPPVAHAGPDQTVEATSGAGASVTLTGDASSDPDGDALTLTWSGPFSGVSGLTPTVLVPLGTHTITVTVDDSKGETASDTTTVAVLDTTPPILTLPPPITAEATGPGGAAVSYNTSALDLVDGGVPVSCTQPAGTLFAVGTTLVTCSASDGRGLSTSGSFAVTVQDTTPPVLTLPASLTVAATGTHWGGGEFQCQCH